MSKSLENAAIEQAKTNKKQFEPINLSNSYIVKQLLARSSYIFKKIKWAKTQKVRVDILFELYSVNKLEYELSQKLSWIF